jgi:hypothetical protein
MRDGINWDDIKPQTLTQNGAVAAGGTGIAYSRWTVPAGELWRFDFAVALHDDDGGARVLSWNISDGTTAIGLDGGQSVTAGVRLQLYGGLVTGTIQGASAMPVPITLGPTGYLEARVGSAMVDGHIVNISGLVRRVKGV